MSPKDDFMTPWERAQAFNAARKPFVALEKQAKSLAKTQDAAGFHEAAVESRRAAADAKSIGDKEGRLALTAFEKSRTVNISAPRNRQQSRQAANPPTSTNRNPGISLGSKSSTRRYHITPNKHHQDLGSEEEMDAQSSGHREGFRTKDTPQTPYLPTKHQLSPSSMEFCPKKRPQNNHFSASTHSPSNTMHLSGMMHSPPPRGSMCAQGSPRGQQYWGQEHSSPYNHGNIPPNMRDPLGQSSSQQSYALYNFDPSSNQEPSYCHESLPSTPNGINGAPRHPDIDIISREQPSESKSWPSTPEAHRYAQSSPSQSRSKKRRRSSLQSPIWNTGAAGEQQRQSGEDHSRHFPCTPLNQRRKTHHQERVYPYKDGGIPGEGGSSSDPDIMLYPQIVGRTCYVGGLRSVHHIVPAAEPRAGPEQVLEPLGHDQASYSAEVNRRRWIRDRRRMKNYYRQLKARWDEARANNDGESMDQVELEAKNPTQPVVPIRDDFAEFGHQPSTSPSPHRGTGLQPLRPVSLSELQSEYQIRPPYYSALVPYVEPARLGQGETDIRYGHTTESSFSRRQNLQPATTMADEIGRQALKKASPGSKDSPGEDFTPFEQALRLGSQPVSYNKSLLHPVEASSRAGMSYKECPLQGNLNNGVRQPHSGPIRFGREVIHGIATPDGQIITPHSRFQQEEATSDKAKSPLVIVLSSTETTPVPKRSLSMKERIDPLKKKATQKSQEGKGKGSAEKKVDPEVARQRRCAENTIAKELKVVNEELEKAIFGEVIGLTPEELENQAELKRRERNRKEEVQLEAEIAKEDARIAEVNKHKEATEAREKEKMSREREEISKKQKREVERKKQLAEEEQHREKRRKQAVERIEAQRSKDRANAEAREKAKEKCKTLEFDKLKLEVLKKDLELKRLQAASLTTGKASSPEMSKESAAKTTPSVNGNSTLFIPETSVIASMVDGEIGTSMVSGARSISELFAQPSNFRAMMAEERERERQEQKEQRELEAKKRFDATRARLEAIRKSNELGKKESRRSAQPKKLRSAPKVTIRSQPEVSRDQNTLINFLNHLISKDCLTSKSAQLIEGDAAPVESNRSGSAPAPITPPKTYESEVRILTMDKRDHTNDAIQIQEEAERQKRLAERRAETLPQIRERKKKKIVVESEMLGLSLRDEEVEARVNAHMMKLEEAYQKKQARRSKNSGSSQTLSQPQPQQQASSQSETEHEDTQASITSQPKLEMNTVSGSTYRKVRYAKRTLVTDLQKNVPKAFENQLPNDSDDESEEDPDSDENEIVEAVIGENQAANGALDAEDDSQHREGTPTGNKSRQQNSNSSGSSSNIADSKSQNSTQKEDPQVKIYTVKRKENKHGEEAPESARTFIDREDANNAAKHMVTEYRKHAGYEEQYLSQKLKERLYYGNVIINDENSLIVEVISEFSTASTYGIDMCKVKALHGEQVWTIMRELESTRITNQETGSTNTKIVREDATDVVYTDRKYANFHACEALIKFLKPPKKHEARFEALWATSWSPQIRDELEKYDGTEDCFQVTLDLEDLATGGVEWLECDEVRYVVEVKKTQGPRN